MVRGCLTQEQLAAEVDSGEIDTVLVAVVDLHGRLAGTTMDARHFLKTGRKGVDISADVLAADPDNLTPQEHGGGIRPGGLVTLRPDLSTLRRAGWRPRTALVLCDILDQLGHAPIDHSPRQILKRQVARAQELGFDVLSAIGLEFHVFDRSAAEIRAGGLPVPDCRRGRGAGHGLQADPADEPLLERLRTALDACDLPVQSAMRRHGPGAHGVRLGCAPALDAAENHAIAKHAAKDIGAEFGRTVSFLSKWHPEGASSASPIHLSLWSGRDPAFLDSSMPHGMSRLMRAFLAGVIRSLDDCTALLAPSVNSYKRFAPGALAPTRKTWSLDTRSAALRLRGEGSGSIRIECALPGADANPCLAVAALLAAGLDGIARQLDCGDPATDEAPDGRGAHVPRTLRDATLALQGSAMLRTAMGDAVVDHYVMAARAEQAAFDRAVTDWEIVRGLDGT